MNINVIVSIFNVILLGFCATLSCWLWYMVIHILRNWHTRIEFDWDKIKHVEILNIDYTNLEPNLNKTIHWIKEISFGNYKIYLGYTKVGEADSIPHILLKIRLGDVPDAECKKYGVSKQGKENMWVGLSLWRKTANFNEHSTTLETLNKLAIGIEEDLLCKINPLYDVHLESIFMENGWIK